VRLDISAIRLPCFHEGGNAGFWASLAIRRIRSNAAGGGPAPFHGCSTVRRLWRFKRAATLLGQCLWSQDDCSAAARKHYLEVLNGWERVIKMMKKRSPTLIFRRLAKADRVIFESVPLDEKHVLIWILDASLQLMRSISVHRRKYGLRLGE
jgi:hypothetical protein